MAGWSKPPTAFIHTVEADLKNKRNTIAAEALQMLVTSSPVDEGSYKGNHRVTVDSEDHGSDVDIKDKDGSDTISAGMAVIDTADRPYQAVTIQNNIAYGERLEDGHSQQAPHGVYNPAFAHLRAKHGKS